MKIEQLQQHIVEHGEASAEERKFSDEIGELRKRQQEAFGRLWGFANRIKDVEQRELTHQGYARGTRVNIVLDKNAQDPIYGRPAVLKAEYVRKYQGVAVLKDWHLAAMSRAIQ